MKKEVEAILFSSSEPISVRDIAKILRVKVEDVEKAVDEIIAEYESRDTAIEVIRLGENVLMRVKPAYQHLVLSKERDLDRSTLRTLAIIAVNQPIELSKLVKIRGNRCYEHVKTKVLTTTEGFIRYFGLKAKSVEEVKEILRSKIERL